MSKRCLVLATLVFTAAAARADSLNIQMVSVEGDSVLMAGMPQAANVVKYVPVTRQVIINGATKSVTEMVPVTTTETRPMSFKLKDVAVYDLDGVKINPDKLAELFKKPRAVVFAASPTISKAARDVLKENTLVLVLQTAPPGDKPMIKK